MAAPTRGELEDLSRDTGYPEETLEVVARLLDLLQAIANDRRLGPHVTLTGGTALNGFHSSWPRLSVDIDLYHMGPAEWDEARKAVPGGNSALCDILVNRGYDIRREPSNEGGGKWRVRFDSCLDGGGLQNLEIDLSYVGRKLMFAPEHMSSAPLGSRVASDVLVLDRREIVASKMNALFSRHRGRDLFDAVEILEKGGLNWEHIKAVFLAQAAAAIRDPKLITIDWIGASVEDVEGGLGRCLPGGFFNGTPIEKWIDDSVERCRRELAHLLEWDDDERAFIEGVRKRGEIDAHLLKGPDWLLRRIEEMPQLRFRCERIKAELNLQKFSFPTRATGPSMGL